MTDRFFGGIKTGSTGVSVHLLVRRKSDNAEVTGLSFNTAGVVASYCRQGETPTAIALAAQTAGGGWTSGGFAEVDAAAMPGLYRLDLPDAAVTTGADFVTLAFLSANNFAFMERIPISSDVIQSGDSFARLGAPTGASLAADVSAVIAKTNNLPPDPADASDVAGAIATVPAAVLAAAATTPIAANMTQIKSIPLS
ncbi:MAG TPA: hypothetical protein VGP25_05065 [Gemmatimonadaceae bacterium]|jgi:hypothetical protein|nr:hypothetical protein [Gemmatimonadaceae bacterium]